MNTQIKPRSRGRALLSATAAVALMGASGFAQTFFTTEVCDALPLRLGSWGDVATVPKFDQPANVLKAVHFSMTGETDSYLRIINIDAGPQTFTVSIDGHLRLLKQGSMYTPGGSFSPADVIIEVNPGVTLPLSLSALGTPPTDRYLNEHLMGIEVGVPFSTTDPTELLAFTGPGVIDLPVVSSGDYSDGGTGNIVTTSRIFSKAKVCVVYEFEKSKEPSMTLTKSASKTTLDPFEKCTYSYTVVNTGGTDLLGVTVRDDNGTPNFAGDDFIVQGSPFDVPVGGSVTVTATVIPPVCLEGVLDTGPVVPAGILVITQVLANGDVKVTYLQDFGINDNTYGTGAVGWPNGHTFGNLTGSDKLEFRFFNAAGSVVLDVYLDTISAIGSITYPGGTITYPSGYGTAGPFGNEGSFVSPFTSATHGNKIVTFSTAISDNLNHPLNVPNKAALIVNSPTKDDGFGNAVPNPALPANQQAPGGWNPINTFSLTVSGSLFTSGGGFGKVEVPDQHNSPAKQGGHVIVPYPTPCEVINTAIGHTVTAGVSDQTATATVKILPPGGPGGSGWTAADIGRPKKKGSSTITGTPPTESFSIDGGGKDIGGGGDQFHYLYKKLSGNCSITARVVTVENTDPKAMAGVMIRETTKKDSKHFSMLVTSGDGIKLKQRGFASPAEVKQAGLGAPYFVRVTRNGTFFQGEYSPTGLAGSWTTLGTRNLSLGADLLVGLAVCSKKDNELCTATFDNVTITP